MINPLYLYDLLIFILLLTAGTYGLYLALRFVRAVERIADKLDSTLPSGVKPDAH